MIEKINYILNPSEDYHTVAKKVKTLKDDYLESRKLYRPLLKAQKGETEKNQTIKNFIDERTYVNSVGPGLMRHKFSVTRKLKPRSATRSATRKLSTRSPTRSQSVFRSSPRPLRPSSLRSSSLRSRFHKSNSFASPLRKARKQRSRSGTRKTSPLGTNKTD
jgi:hypothetical protein